MSLRLAALACALVLCAEPLVFADEAEDWRATFLSSAVASHVTGTDTTFVVIGAGPQSASVRAAAAAFEEALQQSGKVSLVMNDQSLGAALSLDDGALIVKCRALPVTRIAIVRVFSSEGAPPQAVVTVYDRQGVIVSAFAAAAGVPLDGGAAGSGQGVSSAAAESVSSVTSTGRKPSSGTSAQERYDQQYVWFRDQQAARSSGAVLGDGTYAFLGKKGWPLQGAAFYFAVGREDLARRYNSTVSAKSVLTWGGATGALLGLLLVSSGDPGASNDFGGDRDSGDDSDALGATLLVGGLASWIIGLVLEPHPVSAKQARKLAAQYNARLKKELHLARVPARRYQAPKGTFYPFLGGVGYAVEF
jgi:hypothetical protein